MVVTLILKSRTEPKELMTFRLLNKRMNLTNEDKQYYQALQKGYEGEVMFDEILHELQGDWYILNDLLFSVNNNTFQIDTLIITSDVVYIFEIKNYEGDFYYNSGRIFTLKHIEINNPVHQLNRSRYLLQQLIHHLGYHLKVEASVVFIHPHFMLYRAPLDQPFIFPPQLKPYLKNMAANTSHLNEKHRLLAKKLLSLHKDSSPFTQLPKYRFDELKKGITCLKCDSFSVTVDDQYCSCNRCGFKESIKDAVIRSVEEYVLLFPERKITTSAIYEWCKIIPSRKRITNILVKNYKKVGSRRWTYFEK